MQCFLADAQINLEVIDKDGKRTYPENSDSKIVSGLDSFAIQLD